jgi:hypothetical protein
MTRFHRDVMGWLRSFKVIGKHPTDDWSGEFVRKLTTEAFLVAMGGERFKLSDVLQSSEAVKSVCWSDFLYDGMFPISADDDKYELLGDKPVFYVKLPCVFLEAWMQTIDTGLKSRLSALQVSAMDWPPLFGQGDQLKRTFALYAACRQYLCTDIHARKSMLLLQESTDGASSGKIDVAMFPYAQWIWNKKAFAGVRVQPSSDAVTIDTEPSVISKKAGATKSKSSAGKAGENPAGKRGNRGAKSRTVSATQASHHVQDASVRSKDSASSSKGAKSAAATSNDGTASKGASVEPQAKEGTLLDFVCSATGPIRLCPESHPLIDARSVMPCVTESGDLLQENVVVLYQMKQANILTVNRDIGHLTDPVVRMVKCAMEALDPQSQTCLQSLAASRDKVLIVLACGHEMTERDIQHMFKAVSKLLGPHTLGGESTWRDRIGVMVMSRQELEKAMPTLSHRFVYGAVGENHPIQQ